MLTKRDTRFDALRAIGLFAIILAHVNPPPILFQIRNFDVPLMVLVSGTVYGISKGTQKKYFSYILSRLARLLIPTWVFLSFFFAYSFLFYLLKGSVFPYSKDIIISSFTLISGIGYVWIIRVFVLVAIIFPLFAKTYEKTRNKAKYLVFLLSLYIFYELVYLFYSKSYAANGSIFDFILQNFVFYILPFGCIAGLGLFLAKANNKLIASLASGFAILFVFLVYINNNPTINTQLYKYPPRIYYLSYALSVCLFFYLFSKTNIFKKLFSSNLILFIGSSSLWIYLWHIFFLYQWAALQKHISKSFQNYIVAYIFVISAAVIVTYLQKKIIKKIALKFEQFKMKWGR